MWCFPNGRVYFSLNYMNQHAPNWDLEMNKPKKKQIKNYKISAEEVEFRSMIFLMEIRSSKFFPLLQK